MTLCIHMLFYVSVKIWFLLSHYMCIYDFMYPYKIWDPEMKKKKHTYTTFVFLRLASFIFIIIYGCINFLTNNITVFVFMPEKKATVGRSQ